MIELTPEQRQAVDQGEPVRVIDPSTQDAYVIVRAEVYERLTGVPERPVEEPLSQGPRDIPRPVLEGSREQGSSSSAAPTVPSPAEGEPARVRLRDLPTPPDVSEEAERWCKKYGRRGEKNRREVEERLKLQYYYGGRPVYLLDTPAGLVVIPITGRYKDTPDLRYVLLTPEERPRACLDTPSPWRDAASEILT